ncbi:hydantoinase/oxoprolinase family protein [Litorilinea aerophila]|uniref:Hydantoinase/oxoprolinase family protein n=1 Tax=Litorilinea aerophila TaxID=1204385 RepID=A0A540VF49_9CHLR|nr:hydantoinase/oxoprolinase family protein [Litorilinea aerophila]MCC9076915.1 hydantoinase/oxoprolinase family protein [Litorilinea aerophila]
MTSDVSPIPLVGIDVGGTFTDFVVFQDGALRVHKVPTTPEDQSQAMVAGLAALGIQQADIVHGMTVATNALLERRGARTALLTTAGFADVLVIGRQNRPHLYRLSQQRPAPLVEDPWRLEVDERLDHTGRVLRPLDEAAVEQLASRLAAGQVESVAIVFLFSFLNPAHEERAAGLLRARLPELPISLSSQILPEYREYERTATTVINAYVQPLVARYLQRLQDRLAHCRLRIMQSNGGAIGLAQASQQAARVVLSGPAGGVVGAFAVARQATGSDAPQLITLDMGGTSTDVALCPGQIPTTAESTITDLPLRLPVIDIHTVGAGGGSIAYLDAGGGLRVGPRSAGAVPGPVCYGRGGTEPTVTDANLVLGRLAPEGFLGGAGEVTLDRAAARRALARLGEPLGLSPEAAALGVIRVANATMERALRRVSVERGHDPRQFTLLPFGGAGPLHACDLADALQIRRILLPPMPGVLSAYGMLVADVARDASRSLLSTLGDLQRDRTPLQQLFQALAEEVQSALAQEGIAHPTLEAALDLRYRGQSYELTVPLALSLDEAALAAAGEAFHRAHEQRYGYAMPGETVETVNLRVRASSPGASAVLPALPDAGPDATAARLPERPVWFDPWEPTPTPCYDRERLQPGNRLAGPAIVHQFDTTIVITPGWQARVDAYRNIWLEKPQ